MTTEKMEVFLQLDKRSCQVFKASVRTAAEALQRLFKPLADWIAMIKWLNLQPSPSGRVTDLALHHRKRRVRKKNMNRIIRYQRRLRK